ncbi:MAG: 2'-5' RNA ligase family protein [Altererythrobacter sp.]|nr:2'-5' RNA ligase family protein [Altererythrobacter sp.]NNK45664.1 2'-5' RNA ligase family protein [Altererythrobacter sp.]
MPQPFILTAKLPEHIYLWADELRKEHFPPERNQLHAHVTMFHAFAPSLLEELKGFVPQIVREFAAPQAEITGLMDLGKGTAIRLRSPGLLNIRAIIAEHFHGTLTDQDLHEPRPHITIQNKVTKEEARALQASLAPQIEERSFAFPGLELYRYLGGPWEFVKGFPFRGQSRA